MTSSALRPSGVEGEETAGRGSDYAALCRQVRQAGMLKRRPVYYSVKIAANLGLLALGGVAFVLPAELRTPTTRTMIPTSRAV